MKELLLPSKRLIFFSSSHQSFDLLLRFNTTNNNNNIMRRKNPHPQRAVNARTVLKVSGEREEREKEGEEQPPVLCLRIPDEDDDLEANHLQIQKEETTFIKKGTKRKRTQQHECDVCEKAFRQSSDLKRHVRIHTNERPYECDLCDKAFRESGRLQSHMRIHTNEKPYECDVCDKAFRQLSILKRHERTQH